MCELLGAMAGVLERNISGDFARDFKVRAMQSIAAVSELAGRQLPWLPEEFVAFFGEGALSLVAGMYPFSVPTEPVRQVIEELGFPDPHGRFVDGLRTGLVDLADRSRGAKPGVTHFRPWPAPNLSPAS